MSALIKWVPGALSAWSTSAQAGFSSTDLSYFNALAPGGVVVGSSAIANSTNLDLLAEVALDFMPSANPSVGQAWCDVYLLPLGRDGQTYGDGTPSGGQQFTPPGASYKRRTISVRPAASFNAGSTVLHGVTDPFALPRGDFVLGIGITLGSALNNPANVNISIRTTNENTNG